MTPEALEMSKKYAARVMELEKEVVTLKNKIKESGRYKLREQLAAAQATIERLREALQDIRSHATSTGCRLASKALALPADDTALQEQLAQEREKCAGICAKRWRCYKRATPRRRSHTWTGLCCYTAEASRKCW